jgi:hypothetical protein
MVLAYQLTRLRNSMTADRSFRSLAIPRKWARIASHFCSIVGGGGTTPVVR